LHAGNVVKAVDTDPLVTIDTPASNAVVSGDLLIITGTASDSLSGVESVDLAIDTAPFQSVTGTLSWTYEWLLPFPEDRVTHTINARVTDNAGNEWTATNDFYVDTAAPIAWMQPISSTQNSPRFTLAWEATDASGVQTFDVQYQKGANDWQDWLVGTTLRQSDFNAEGGYTYTFRVRATDIHGNLSEFRLEGQVSTSVKVMKVFLPLVQKPRPNVIANGGFETANFNGWTVSGTSAGLGQAVSPGKGLAGSYGALLGNPAFPCTNVPTNASSWLYQTVTVPTWNNPKLTFWYRINSQDVGFNGDRQPWDTLEVSIQNGSGQLLQTLLQEGGPYREVN
jgi:hypothetical protein